MEHRVLNVGSVDGPDLQRKSSKPLHSQIYEYFYQRIQEGELKPGDQLPPELDLAEQFGVARITVRRAIMDLEREGLVVRQAGKGTFVSRPKIAREFVNVTSFTDRMAAAGLTASARVLAVTTLPANKRLAQELALPEGSPVVCFTRLRYTNDEPTALEDSYLSLERCPGLDQIDLDNKSLYRLLEEKYGLHPVRSRKTLEIVQADTQEARHLGVTRGAPLFLLRATVLGSDAPIEYAKIRLRGDRFLFRI